MQVQFDIAQVCFTAGLISTKNSRIISFISVKDGKKYETVVEMQMKYKS